MKRRGELAQALFDAALTHGPGTVRELAARSGIAYGAARYTATRLVGRGEFVVVEAGRPARLMAAPAVQTQHSAIDEYIRAFDALR